MSAFAETLGIEGVEVKEGICSMTIDDISMEFTESPGGEAVIGVAVIGEPPRKKPPSATRRRPSSPGSAAAAPDS